MMDNLRNRVHIIVNGAAVLNRFGMIRVMPRTIHDLFLQGWITGGLFRQKTLQCFSLFAVVWKIWIERNSRVFHNKSSGSCHCWIYCAVCFRVGNSWEGFADVSMLDILLSWDACFQGHRTAKPVKKNFMVALLLNFVRCFYCRLFLLFCSSSIASVFGGGP